MYGDMARLGQRSTELRMLATGTRTSAGTLRSAVGIMWVSAAAAEYTKERHERANDLDKSADSLDEAADAIDAHIRSVEAVKQAIADAERWISDRWDDAAQLTATTVEVITDGVANAFEMFGAVGPHVMVNMAADIPSTVPALPASGSFEWLNLADTFDRQGWRS
jgi:hypothetical protein